MATLRNIRSTPARRARVPASEVAAAMVAIARANFLFASALLTGALLTDADVAKARGLIAALNPDAVPLAAKALYRLWESGTPELLAAQHLTLLKDEYGSA
jgi:hypothetical protein